MGEQVRTEQGASDFLEQQTGFPVVRHMRRGPEPETVPAGLQQVILREDAGRTNREVVDADQRADQAAGRLRLRCQGQPLIERAAFVGFEMAERDPSKGGWIEDACDRIPHQREHLLHTRVKEQWFLVLDQEVVEPEIEVLHIDRNRKMVRSYLHYPGSV